jgi:hypothetical protein
MLISIPQDRSQTLLGRLQENYPRAQAIGRATDPAKRSIVVER